MKNKDIIPSRLAVFCIAMAAALILASSSGRKEVRAETKELWAVLAQEPGDTYESSQKLGLPVCTKVKLTKNTIVIYGTIRDNDSEKTGKSAKHTYRLSENVTFAAEGGTAPEQKMTKKKFRAYLKKVKDSGLGLILELKENQVVRVSVSS